MANELFPPPEKGKKQEGTDYSEKITHLNTRIKLLEERNGTLHKKNQITDDRFREVSKDAVREIRDLSEDLLAIKSTLHEMQAELALLRSEMKFLARQPELKEIETYINLWQPQNFVTRQELEEVKKVIQTTRIQDMQGQGLTKQQIIEILQKEGHSSSDIFNALSRAEIKTAHTQNDATFGQEVQPQDHVSSPKRQHLAVEELVETVIDEKWNEVIADINKIIDWKNETQITLSKLSQQLNDVQAQVKMLNESVLGKVAEYDKHILNVGAEVKAMEKVFSQVLPLFTENVAKLAAVAQKMDKKLK